MAATAIFAAAAAHTTRHATAASSSGATGSVDDQGVVESDDGTGSWTLTPSQSSPSQSFGPPVARSGGS